jgi:hypothetical protein
MSADQDDDLYGDLQVSTDTVLAADVSLAQFQNSWIQL